MAEIADLMAACNALEASKPDPSQRRQHVAHLREGLAQLADEIRDLRAQRESLESQVMELANEMTAAQRSWENVVDMSAYFDDDEDDEDDPEYEPGA